MIDALPFSYRLDLTLRTAFGTSHSATSARSNALVVVSIDGHVGLGEAGAPPCTCAARNFTTQTRL